MNDQLAEDPGYAEGWRPKPGDRVAGTVSDIAATDGGYGIYPVVTLKTAEGTEVAVHAFHTVLRKELARRRPTMGDDLDITYLGKKSEGGGYGRGYDMYRVRSSKDAKGYDWDSELSDDERVDVPADGDVPGDVPIAPAAVEPVAVAAPSVDDDDVPF